MFRKVLFILGILFMLCKQINAQEVKNNKFGIGLAQPHLDDLQNAREMINSNGGDWGYITLVIQENDRNKEKWQEIFDRLRELHLIPIIRLATQPEGSNWRKPNLDDAEGWVNFLDSLNWVVKDRYIILFNEPNHATEWGGNVDAKNYAEVAFEFAKQLKTKNQDFFIMLAGLDASAPQSLPRYEDEASFLGKVINNKSAQEWNSVLSGLSSHSYPNPAFAGSPVGSGRGTVRTYQWELQLLSTFGVKELPVFITETGWDRGILGEDLTASHLKTSFDTIWLPDERVKAVTPFVLDYQGEPFLDFSWKLPSARATEDNKFYLQYYIVKSLAKVAGEPFQYEKGELNIDFPKELVAHSSYHLNLRLQNEGQAVWDKEFGYRLLLLGDQSYPFEYFFSDLKNIRPFEETDVDLFIKTNGNLGKSSLHIELQKDDKTILKSNDWNFEIFPLPSLEFSVGSLPFWNINGDDFEIQVFNQKEELVFNKKHVVLKKGKGKIDEIQNVFLATKYRVVILKPGYLPRQTFVTFKKGTNSVKFELMWPFDFNKDGKLDGADITDLFSNH